MKRNASGKPGSREKEKEERGLSGLTEKQILVFLLEFLAVSALFLAVWYYIGEFYQGAIFFVARPILLAMDCPLAVLMDAFSGIEQAGGYLGNFNLVPLVALAIATPKLPVRRRIEMLAIGVPILFLLHVLDLVAHYPYAKELEIQSPGFATLIVDFIGVAGVAIPFVIWFVICYSEFSGR